MKILIDVHLVPEGHRVKFEVEDYKTLDGKKIDVTDYNRCLAIAREEIDRTLKASSVGDD